MLEDLTGLSRRPLSPSPSSLSLKRQTQSVKQDKEGKSAPYDTLLNSFLRQNTKCRKISQFDIVEYSKIGCIFCGRVAEKVFFEWPHQRTCLICYRNRPLKIHSGQSPGFGRFSGSYIFFLGRKENKHIKCKKDYFI